MKNKTYQVTRTLHRVQYQIVDAESEDEAWDLAVKYNPENFEDCMNSDDDWQYKTEEVETTTVIVPLEM